MLTGQRYASAWAVLDHQARARELRLCARRYRASREPGDLDRALDLLTAYARLYEEVAGSGWSGQAEAWMLRGKLFSQALTEALWGVQVADAVAVLAADPASRAWLDEPVTALLRELMTTVADARRLLVDERGELRSNYTAWLDCAGATAARALRALGEPEDPRPWTKGGFEQLRAAVGDDGWEWEAATYYHVFVLRAHLLALHGVEPAALPRDVADRLAGMVRVLSSLAAPDGDVPVLHDGPYRRDGALLELIEVCVLARQLWTSTGLDGVERHARRALSAPHDGLEDLLDGWFAGPPRPPLTPDRGSVRFADAGILVLRDPDDTWQAVVDAGAHGGSHGHLDKLALYLYGPDGPWQPAPGVPPYGSPLRRGHYARTLAHPTVRVGDADQASCTGRIEEWNAAPPARAVVSADDAFPGVMLRRSLIMTEDYLLDVVRVRTESGEEQKVVLGSRPAARLDVRSMGDGWRTRWASANGGTSLSGIHAASVPAVLDVVPGRGPSVDPAAFLAAADWTATAADVTFVSAYWPGVDERIAALEARPDRLRVQRASGHVDEYPREDA
ncbi:heparinase II/III domain-containing protein [Haloactinopolyspora alba]|uniref:heparinase II/III domain-containing protein n=1 Tax=Haloactinopolyspora alba TaxID=648780 RepID=UPI000D0CC3C7|nr:heparinase II/III family protein [Haloactinopolyspora alba]